MSSPPSPAGNDGPSKSSRQGNATVYQTTGPDAYHDPIMSPGSGTPALNPRSCVTCRRRKVRCDKQMPCSNCRRALIPCVFPAPGRAPRQQKAKDPNAPPKTSSQREAELIKRLRKLEGIVEELSGQIEVESAGRNTSSESPGPAHYLHDDTTQRHGSGGLESIPADEYLKEGGFPSEAGSDLNSKKKDIHQQFGRMVLSDQKGTTRYVSSGFWSKMNDEINSIRSETQLLTDEEYDESDWEESPTETPGTGSAAPASANQHGFILGYRSTNVDLSTYHPLPSHSAFLWSVYQENVEPLVKLVHVPSVDLILRDARKSSSSLSPADEALVFAIYFSALIALEPEEVAANLNASKDELLSQYRFAAEQALSKADYLNTPDIAVLQAFTLLLLVVRRHDDTRFVWSLTSLAIRLGQGMGLHRDPSHFEMTPYDAEMRRRLWWGLMALDLRSAEELGTDLTITNRSFDTSLPANINDADISPESTEVPESKIGRSDCAVALVRYEICSMARQLHFAASASASMCPKSDLSSMEEKEQTLVEIYQKVEHKFLQHVVDQTDPLYWVAAMISRIIMAKSCLVIYHSLMFPGSNHELSVEVRQRLFVSAIEIIECNYKLNTDPRCKQYRWLFKTYAQWHAIAYVLIETCRRPWTALVERGWLAANEYEGDPMELTRKADHAAVFLPLRRLFTRARKHREAELVRLQQNPEEARKLDFAERMNPVHSRFGPIPGAENKMEEMREHWRMVLKPESSPTPFLSNYTRGQDVPSPSVLVNPAGQSQNASGQSSMPSSTSAVNQPVDMSNAMEYMDQLMSQPNVAMPDFFSLTQAGNQVSFETSGMMAGGMPMDQEALRQQALAMSTQLPKDDNLPPYLWSEPFPPVNSKAGDVLMDEGDFMGENFNWQDWSQSIRGLEVESTQTPPPNQQQPQQPRFQ